MVDLGADKNEIINGIKNRKLLPESKINKLDFQKFKTGIESTELILEIRKIFLKEKELRLNAIINSVNELKLSDKAKSFARHQFFNFSESKIHTFRIQFIFTKHQYTLKTLLENFHVKN